MKPNQLPGCLLATLVIITSSCAKEIVQNQDHGDPHIIYAKATLTPKHETKLLYSEIDPVGLSSGLSSVWQDGDFFYALTQSGDCARFDLVSGAGTSTASFSADMSNLDVDAGTVWTAVFGNHGIETIGAIRCNYDNQSGELADIGDYSYIVANGTGSSPQFNFGSATRLSYFVRFRLPAGVRYVEYCTTANWKVTPSSTSIIYDGHFNDVYEIDLGSASSSGDVCYLAIPAIQYGNYINEKPKGVIVTFFNADKTKSNGGTIGTSLSAFAGNVGTVDLSGLELIDRPLPEEAISLGAIQVTMEKDPDGNFCNKYDNLGDYRYTTMVSPAWAPFNLGAKVTAASPSADDLYGDFFMWGETAPRTEFSSTDWIYDGSHTVGSYENFPSTQIGKFFTYAVTDGNENGVLKLQKISGSKYDPARVRWGSAWRMPAIEELLSLTGSSISIDADADETVTASGLTTEIITADYYNTGCSIKGRTFTKDANTVFFPFGGFYGTGRGYQGNRGFYWSDSRIRATPDFSALVNNALRLEMTGGGINYGRNSNPSTEMYFGLNIRPVRNYPNKETSATSPSVLEDYGDVLLSPSTNLFGFVKDSHGNGIAGVTVSDGYSCVSTNSEGLYEITANAAARTVNVTIPAAYEIPIGPDGRPAFFYPISIPSSGLVRKDFTLTARQGGAPARFTILALSDAHVQNSLNLSRFNTTMADVQATVTALGTGIPVGDGGSAGEVIGIALGDQLWDDMSMADEVRSKFCNLTNTSGGTVPVFYVIGNHDHDASGSTDYERENCFVNHFGPTNYSFDIGNAHVIVMDNILSSGSRSGSNGTYTVTYSEGFTSAQVAWLQADVAKVSGHNSKQVIFCCHAPLNVSSGGDSGTQNAVMGTLRNNFYNVHVLSGHTHSIKNNLYAGWSARSGRSIYEHTMQSMSGYWWDADICSPTGSAAGYGVLTFGTNDIVAEYNKVTKESAGFQMRVYNGKQTYNKNDFWGQVWHDGDRGYKEYNWEDSVKNKFVVRILDAGSSNDSEDYWTVQLTYGGTTTNMTRVSASIKDAATASYVFNQIKGTYGDAEETIDQIWYSSVNFGTPFTITATHHMRSGWTATYTTSSYVGTDYKGFAYGQHYD